MSRETGKVKWFNNSKGYGRNKTEATSNAIINILEILLEQSHYINAIKLMHLIIFFIYEKNEFNCNSLQYKNYIVLNAL